jgi:hypothetical protein
MKITQIALTCVVLVAAQTGISQPLPKAPPANAMMPTGIPQMGSANDHEIQKLNMEMAKLKTEIAQESAKFKTDLAALTSQLATLTAKYGTHTHEYYKTSFDFGPAKAKCVPQSDCKFDIWFDKYSPRWDKIQVSMPIN